MKAAIQTLFGSALVAGALFVYWAAISFYAEMPRHSGFEALNESLGDSVHTRISNISDQTSPPLSTQDSSPARQYPSVPDASFPHAELTVGDRTRNYLKDVDQTIAKLTDAELDGDSLGNANLGDTNVTGSISRVADPGTTILNPRTDILRSGTDIVKVSDLSGDYFRYLDRRDAANMNPEAAQGARDWDQGFSGVNQTLVSFDTASARAVSGFPEPAAPASPFQVPGVRLPPFEPPAVQVAPFQVPAFQVPAVPPCCVAP